MQAGNCYDFHTTPWVACNVIPGAQAPHLKVSSKFISKVTRSHGFLHWNSVFFFEFHDQSNFHWIFSAQKQNLKDFGDVVVSGPQVLLHGPSPRGRTRFCKAGSKGDQVWGVGTNMFFSSWMKKQNLKVLNDSCKLDGFLRCLHHLPANFVNVTQSRGWKGAAQRLARPLGLIEDDHVFLNQIPISAGL